MKPRKIIKPPERYFQKSEDTPIKIVETLRRTVKRTIERAREKVIRYGNHLFF